MISSGNQLSGIAMLVRACFSEEFSKKDAAIIETRFSQNKEELILAYVCVFTVAMLYPETTKRLEEVVPKAFPIGRIFQKELLQAGVLTTIFNAANIPLNMSISQVQN